MKNTISQKEQLILDKIDKYKQELVTLREKRKKEIGEIAIKAGLADLDNRQLKTTFERLANELTA